MQDNKQLAASIILGLLALIPNNALRYTSVGLAACLGIVYTIYLKYPPTQLRQLQEFIENTHALIRRAKLQCPGDQLSIADASLRLLEVDHSVSMIYCVILQTPRLTWKEYRMLSTNITERKNSVKRIHATVQLTVQAERQRKLAAEIGETQYILCTVRGPTTQSSTFPQQHTAFRRALVRS
ncbi:hypothetical protein B0H17DRAFT_1329038 [Mycena rosella]|uniref:Uncharacterized protein n=1 Tax=Mycena rosella TaxID=1033263 RepID=A0AAD7DSI4_MYCRO|nr:hypothetical protein B0H17DRAFT_1329038 [Mycena rosella]